MKNTNQLIKEIARLYHWLDKQIQNPESKIPNSCNACGNCCDFDSYGHRLYITSLELIYLVDKLGSANFKPMTGGRCPYQIDNKCSIHEHRFASCRIFFCRGNSDWQNELSEETLKRLKAICEKFNEPYRYMDLKTALSL